ncbi:MAG: lipoyl synthase [Alphaproteobacteria bacterium]|nr:lipoyl synthase [Alphaproteobacteria bacterium]MCB9694303.1 lipoyl synthase [Alphaproteobacteria bacterium]
MAKTTSAKPPWLKVRLPGSPRYQKIKGRARDLRLATVCEEARCPNIGECWGGGTATFMVMGDTCTRGCRFCAVKTLKTPAPLDPDEPVNVAQAIAEMELDYVVLTSVDRDDLPDQGASHFAACVNEIHARSPSTLVEVLIPDFQGHGHLLTPIVESAPEVLAHNVETVERLTPRVRDPRAGYHQSLRVLAAIKAASPRMFTKSSLMVGVGETEPEMLRTMRDLRDVGCDFLTIGQYLQPTKKHLAVEGFVHPDQFAAYEAAGLEMGFRYVASGPLVRSSYKAGEFYIQRAIEERANREAVEA